MPVLADLPIDGRRDIPSASGVRRRAWAIVLSPDLRMTPQQLRAPCRVVPEPAPPPCDGLDRLVARTPTACRRSRVEVPAWQSRFPPPRLPFWQRFGKVRRAIAFAARVYL